MWGQLRDPMHQEKGTYVTRMGGAMCDETTTYIGTVEEWNNCLNVSAYSDYTQFYECFQPTVHAYAHMFVGGSRNPNASAPIKQDHKDFNAYSYNETLCLSWMQYTQVGSVDLNNLITKQYGHPSNPFKCFFCPSCDLDDPSLQCQSCHLVPKDKTCIIKQDGITYSTSMNDETEEYIWGDFGDLFHSPNDPFFMLHHINLDRYSFIWQAKNYQLEPYYDFPLHGWADGLNLNDVMSNDDPFTNVYDYMLDSDREISSRDVFDATTFENVPYMYDDVFEAIEKSVLAGYEKRQQQEQEQEQQQQLLQEEQKDQSLISGGFNDEGNIVSGGSLNTNLWKPEEWLCIVALIIQIGIGIIGSAKIMFCNKDFENSGHKYMLLK